MKLGRILTSKRVAQVLGAVTVSAVLAILFLPTPERNTTGMKGLSPHHFAVAIFSGAKPGEEDHVRNLTIYPVDAAPDRRQLQYASGELFVPRGAGGAYEPFVLCAELPFHYKVLRSVEPAPTTSPAGVVHMVRKYSEGRSPTLTAFVNVDAKYRGDVTFAWWASPRLVSALWALVIAAASGLAVMGAARLWAFWLQSRAAARLAAERGNVLAAAEPRAGDLPPEEPHSSKKYEGEYYPVEHPDAKPQ